MKVILRVPKFFPGVRPDLPEYSTTSEEGSEEPAIEEGVSHRAR
jgi:hypothetical protein